MTNTKYTVKLITYALLLIVLFMGLVSIFSELGGLVLKLELIGFLFLVLLALRGFLAFAARRDERAFLFVFTLYLANLVALWVHQGKVYFVLLFVALFGFLRTIPWDSSKKALIVREPEPILDPSSLKKAKAGEKASKEVKKSSKSSQQKSTKKKASVQKTSTSAKKTARATHSPGKFIASKNSNRYHVPKCEWAKKIKKERRVWFAKKQEAWEQGYKAHSCIEK